MNGRTAGVWTEGVLGGRFDLVSQIAFLSILAFFLLSGGEDKKGDSEAGALDRSVPSSGQTFRFIVALCDGCWGATFDGERLRGMRGMRLGLNDRFAFKGKASRFIVALCDCCGSEIMAMSSLLPNKLSSAETVFALKPLERANQNFPRSKVFPPHWFPLWWFQIAQAKATLSNNMTQKGRREWV